ncbi:MAG TPA: hypothetical protein DEH78_22755 [Solibacterales bacterium]|nr:hypothetical protein [Bryobacterales bacterium]
MRINRLLLASYLLSGGTASWLQGQGLARAGEASGVVETEGGTPIVHALVFLKPTSAAPGEYRQSYFARSSAEGRFTIASPEVGEYHICVDPQEEDLVSPCIWPRTRQVLRLAAGQSVKNLRVVLEKGKVFRFRVDDPEKLLPSALRPEAKGQVLVGLDVGSGFVMPAREYSVDLRGRDYRVTVLGGELVRPVIQGFGLRVLSERAEPLRASDLTEERVQKGQAARQLRFVVIGNQGQSR